MDVWEDRLRDPTEELAARLLVDLVEHENIERIPESTFVKLLGINIKRIDLWAFEASAPAKVNLALDLALNRIIHKDG